MRTVDWLAAELKEVKDGLDSKQREAVSIDPGPRSNILRVTAVWDVGGLLGCRRCAVVEDNKRISLYVKKLLRS
jgi:hypothetical protein